MPKRVLSSEERLLGERLRSEAVESRPAFSESLHHRILCAIGQRHAAEMGMADGPAASRGWGRGLLAALAAACLLCAAAIGWRLLENVPQQGPVKKPPAMAAPSIADLPFIDDLADQAAVGLDGLAASVALKPQAADLKHDAGLVANAFLDRLPVDVRLVTNP